MNDNRYVTKAWLNSELIRDGDTVVPGSQWVYMTRMAERDVVLAATSVALSQDSTVVGWILQININRLSSFSAVRINDLRDPIREALIHVDEEIGNG